ncbi:MAG: acetylxylan esterase [Treponemataceae bacterium]|nr:MAG: acetylxylan esterase [Treponemataceae bacterium]
MLTHDALELFGSYKSAAKKPADFDTFWDLSLREIDGLVADFSKIEKQKIDIASNVADFYSLYFTGAGGARLHCQFVSPKNATSPIGASEEGASEKKHPVMLQFHGYHSDCGDYTDKVALAAEGFYVFALDIRGQGGKSEDTLVTKGGTLKGLIIRGVEDGKEKLYYRNVFLDTALLARIAFSAPNVDERNVYVQGVSQGGALSLACAALEPRVSKAFVQYPFLSDYREAFRQNVLVSAYEELAYYFRFRDPLHLTEEKFFETLDYIDIQFLAQRITASVIWGIALEDTSCPPKTQFAVYNNLTQAAKKTMLFYPEYAHEYLPRYADAVRPYMLDFSGETADDTLFRVSQTK